MKNDWQTVIFHWMTNECKSPFLFENNNQNNLAKICWLLNHHLHLFTVYPGFHLNKHARHCAVSLTASVSVTLLPCPTASSAPHIAEAGLSTFSTAVETVFIRTQLFSPSHKEAYCLSVVSAVTYLVWSDRRFLKGLKCLWYVNLLRFIILTYTLRDPISVSSFKLSNSV
jgi:hypothetical protein